MWKRTVFPGGKQTMDLNGKCVLLGVSGGIAAYKMANVASALRKLGADVEVIMTKNATQFITPLTFETLTGHKCMVDTFDRDFKFEVTHISLAKKRDTPAGAGLQHASVWDCLKFSESDLVHLPDLPCGFALS